MGKLKGRLSSFLTYAPHPSMSTSAKSRDVCIVGVARTPIGGLLGTLSSLSATELGSIAIKSALERANVDPSLVQEVFFGNVLSANLGQAPARQAALGAGIPTSVICTTINKVCASGMKATMLAALTIQFGLNDVVVAGGMESMSNAPKYLAEARKGSRYGHDTIIDGMVKDGLWDVYNNFGMGACAELCADQHVITRDEQDSYAIRSFERGISAQNAGHFAWEIVPVEVSTGRGRASTIVDKDEGLGKFDAAKLRKLRPSFKEVGGSVTAGNASSISDGAAALVLVSEEKARELGLHVIAKIKGYGDAAKAPELFTTAPSLAIPKAISNAGLDASQIDYYEINEAFSVVALANQKLLALNPEKVNVYGGAVSLGHPLGCSGARILVTLLGIFVICGYLSQVVLQVLRQKRGKYGVAAICNGGGGASALVLELIPFFQFRAKKMNGLKKLNSPRGEVGEIDTRAPFQSVKAAVSLFGEVAITRDRFSVKRRSSENVYEKETQLILAQKELNKIKKQVNNAEAIKTKALSELENAKEILQNLTSKLANYSAKLNSERIGELSNEIATMKASIEQLKLASEQSQEENEAQLVGYYKTAKQEAQRNLESLKNEYDSELMQSLDVKLAQTSAEIEALQEKIKKLHASKMDSVRLLTSELKEATKTLEEVAEEKNSLKKLVFSLRTELKQVKKEQDEVKEKEHAAEALAANLTSKLQGSMRDARPKPGTVDDLEANIFYVQSVKIWKLQLETEGARKEAEEMRRKAQELKQEAEKSRAVAKEAEEKLELVLVEAEEAKAAEQRAVKEIKILSEVGRVPYSKFNGKIKMSNEEFEALRAKAKECEDLVEKKEAIVMAELQEIYARKNEVDRKVETNLKAIEETKAAEETALWSAEMADSAKVAIESELRRWRQ
ncbi:hypothetical protein JHK85_020419 [Glycine max]|nr:hypothetical protein JHK85_020419 [Glycine max]